MRIKDRGNLSIHPSLNQSISQSIYLALSPFCLCLCLCLCPCLRLCACSLSLFHSVYLTVAVWLSLSIYLSISVSLPLSLCLCLCLCLSVRACVCVCLPSVISLSLSLSPEDRLRSLSKGPTGKGGNEPYRAMRRTNLPPPYSVITCNKLGSRPGPAPPHSVTLSLCLSVSPSLRLSVTLPL